jgi:hypothetical protein
MVEGVMEKGFLGREKVALYKFPSSLLERI